MPELEEVFRMATQRTRPEPGALERQHARERRRVVRQKTAVYLLVALVTIGVVIAAITVPRSPREPANRQSGLISAPSAGEHAVIVGLDGSIRQTVTAVPGGSCCPALSPDGTRIAFVAGVNISVVGIDGTGLRELEPAFAASSTPSWSPDGSQIAFVGSRDGGQDDIYVMDADGSNVRRLTNDLADDDWPAWSPDGGTIAYANSGSRPLDASGFSPTDEIYTVPATGGRPTRLTDNRVDDTMPSYSPDGSQIAIHRSGGLWIMNADGSNAREIPLPGGCCTGFTPRWSPDGTKIAFTRCCASWRYNGLPVLAVNIVDLNDRVLPVPGAEMVTDANVPQWLPSGDELLLYRVERPRS